MRPILYTLTSSLHGEMAPDPRQEPFIRELEAALGTEFDCRGEASFAGCRGPRESSISGVAPVGESPALIYIRTGGTEGLFVERFRAAGLIPGAQEADPHPIPGKGPVVRLLASGQSNSLAAAMEILSWLRQHGIPGEILHGSPAAIAARIRAFTDPTGAHAASPTAVPGAEEAGFVPGSLILEGKRFGVIGRPSDWLISSGVDYAVARERLGAELVDIPIEELVAEARKQTPTENLTGSGDTLGHENGPNPGQPTQPKPLNEPKFGRKIDAEDWQGALAIYEALKVLVARYRLDGLTLRCFDLLTALHNTGCLALARLNAEGVTATCEGDIPAMLSMAVARALTGRSSFQVNLSRIEGDRLLFAHCTVPLDIVQDYCYDTHFESGIGVAIHGILPEGPVTLFKLAPDCRHVFRRGARLVANPYGDNLCRTQVVVEAPGAAAYFLQEPIGNHHIIVPGKL